MPYALGIDLGGTKMAAGVVDEEGRIHHQMERDTPTKEGGEAVMRAILDLASEVIAGSGLAGREVVSIGMGTPGIIDSASGICISPAINIPGWHGMPIKKRLEEAISLPAFVDNDVNVIALGEFTYGAGVGANTLLCIAIGTGIGGGLVINGRVHRGASFVAGEFGHISVAADGPLCGCGNYGCVERFASAPAIAEQAREYLRSGVGSRLLYMATSLNAVNTKLIAQAASEGDSLARFLIQRAGTYIGVALTGVINLLNPDVVVIGGAVAQAGAVLFDAIDWELRRRAITPAYEAARVVPAQLGTNAGTIGAAALAWQGVRGEG